LLPLLSNSNPSVRGAAALAMAKHEPKLALKVIPARLRLEMTAERAIYDDYIKRGKPQLTPDEITRIMDSFRCQMKLVHAIAMLNGNGAIRELEEQAFRPQEDFSQMNALVATFQLWDRIGLDPQAAAESLGSDDPGVANRAEWMLVQGGPAVLPQVRKLLLSENRSIRERAARIVAFQGDLVAVEALKEMEKKHSADAELVKWAVAKIISLHSQSED
jgi:hypothetical protein